MFLQKTYLRGAQPLGDGFKIKRIEVKPGASLSLQMNRRRSEHWVVVNGSAMVVNGQ